VVTPLIALLFGSIYRWRCWGVSFISKNEYYL